ncbi:nucleotide-diphospho-sugar transferase [Skeletonema marinoi]|uniref:Nucleotide-diphospho-sugar transferase n=1 Tax=Skeletonema marinoi TaxID=267567 RepID=A0AAD9DBE8_9STRA|nr:nucleotide-diphospho-sugar transferase [Skeletonema marinoi]
MPEQRVQRSIHKKLSSSRGALFKTTTWILIVICASCSSFYIGAFAGIAASSGQNNNNTAADHKLNANNNNNNQIDDKELQRRAEELADQKLKLLTSSHKLQELCNKHMCSNNPADATAASHQNHGSKEHNYSPDHSITLPMRIVIIECVFTDIPGGMRQCFALIGGQYQSYHVQRWMRRADNRRVEQGGTAEIVIEGHTGGGREEFPAPRGREVSEHQEVLKRDKVKVDVCVEDNEFEAGSRNDLQSWSVGATDEFRMLLSGERVRFVKRVTFPTDVETKELAEGLGLTTFYEEKLMASVQKRGRNLWDIFFTKIMFAKIVCVQLVNELGYDLLFMDVDIVWYRNPIDYFMNKSLPQFDIYFQDDGSRQERYAPYSANSGFYFVRANPRTQHLFRHLLYSGDLLNAWNSHQQVLIALLAEYNSLMGLKVKVFAKETELFPGGWLYHRQQNEMKRIMKAKNKRNKLNFFQQIGQWYVQETCIGKHYNDIVGGDSTVSLSTHCCLAEPVVICHYRDKPSKIPCNDSPYLDKKRGKPFW